MFFSTSPPPPVQVSLLDTDLEAEVCASIETETRIRREEEEARARQKARELEALAVAEAQKVSSGVGLRIGLGVSGMHLSCGIFVYRQSGLHWRIVHDQSPVLEQSILCTQREEEEAAERQAAAAAAAAQRQSNAAELAARLPPEPAAGTDQSTTCMIQLPDGQRIRRRFLLTDSLQTLFDVVEAQGAERLPEKYRLVLRFPPRKLHLTEETANDTLANCGLAGPQDALLVESES